MNTLAYTTINQFFPNTQGTANRYALTQVVLAFVGVAMLTLSAKIQVPFYPVPMTLQTMVVLLIGLTYGTRLGVATVMAYLALGAMNFPVFAGTPAKGLGLAYMMGPTGGYLLGFVASCAVVGTLAQRLHWDRFYATTFLAMVVGHLVQFALGLMGLGLVIGFDKPLFALGYTPFVYGELAKALAVMAMLPTAWTLINRIKD